ncbi:MAG: transcription termination factor NusA [Pseudomonadota bacterium]|nr:transcription termination factor NusA [Pseudomonadota bacterium]
MSQQANKEIKVKLYLDYIQSQTGLDVTDIAEEMATALESVIIKNRHYPTGAKIHVQIDPSSGLLEIFREWLIVSDQQDPVQTEHEMPLHTASAMTDEATVGQTIYEALPANKLGRIAAQQAKQLFAKIVRDGQLAQKKKQYENQVGDVITAKVKRVKRDYILIETHDQCVGIINKQHLIPRENFREEDKITGIILNTTPEFRSAAIEISRTSNEFLKKLFHNEVPEIYEGSIEIMSVAREPGARAKVSVKSNDRRVDPIGSCIGMRGSRVQAVSNELNGERIDIIVWDDDPVKMVIQSLAPGKIESIELNETEKTMDLHVTNENLSQVIGRSGQNIKLASQLTGWRLNIKKQSVSDEAMIEKIRQQLDVDEQIAEILVQHNFNSAQSIIQMSAQELEEKIPDFDEEIASVIIERAQDALLELTLTGENLEKDFPLLKYDSINIEFAETLKANGILNDEDLAELSVDELTDIIAINPDDASDIIMHARKPWFQQDDKHPE